jgi:hypothetical protein
MRNRNLKKITIWSESWKDIAQRTTYAFEEIVQLADGLFLLPLYAANPDSWSVDRPFAPDRRAVLDGPSGIRP